MVRTIRIAALFVLSLLPSEILPQSNTQITPSKDDLRYALDQAVATITGMHELPVAEISSLVPESRSVLGDESEGLLRNLHSIILSRAEAAATISDYQNDLDAALYILRGVFRIAPDKANELFKLWQAPAPGTPERDDAFRHFQEKFASARIECSLDSEDPLKALEAFQANPHPDFSPALLTNLLIRLDYRGNRDIAAKLFEQEATVMLSSPARRQELFGRLQLLASLVTIPPQVWDGYAKYLKTTFRSDMVVSDLKIDQVSLPLNAQEQMVFPLIFNQSLFRDTPSAQYLLNLFPSLKEKLASAGGLAAFRKDQDVAVRYRSGDTARWRISRRAENDAMPRLRELAMDDPNAAYEALISEFGDRDDFHRVLYIAESNRQFPALSSSAWRAAKALVWKQQSQSERASMTWELLESYIRDHGTIDSEMVNFGLDILKPGTPAGKRNPNDRFNPRSSSGLEIYIIGEWAAIDFGKAVAHISEIPDDLFQASAWIEIAAAYDRRVARLRQSS